MQSRRFLSILLTVALLLTMLSVAVVSVSAAESYELVIDGVQVTSDNADDILGNGVFTYDASYNALIVSGDYTAASDDYIIDNAIEDLIVYIDEVVSFSGEDFAICTSANMTLTGGTLQMDTGIYVVNNASLTIYGMELIIDDDACVWGITGDEEDEELCIVYSDISVSTEKAICDFGTITLDGCVITEPIEGAIVDGSIVGVDGNVASDVVISCYDEEDCQLMIDGVAVTSENAADILGDGVFSYDFQTSVLTVDGDAAAADENLIIENNLAPMTINVVSDSTLIGGIESYYDLTILGDGALTVDSGDEMNCGIYMQNSSSLTIDGMTMTIYGTEWGITGDLDDETLLIINSDVTASSIYAINDFAAISLQGCRIISPDGAWISGGDILTADGDIASNVVISTADAGYVLGDANSDGEVSILDATRIQRYLAELIDADGIDLLAADVDLDTEVTIFDATRIQRYLAELCNLDGTTPYIG